MGNGTLKNNNILHREPLTGRCAHVSSGFWIFRNMETYEYFSLVESTYRSASAGPC